MTKRKRDIFTVIESINNWFEAGEHCTITSEASEASANHLVTGTTSHDPLTANRLAAEVSEPWTEAVHVDPNCSHVMTNLNPQSEVADPLIPALDVSCPVTAGSRYGPVTEDLNQDNRYGGVQTTGDSLCTSETAIPGSEAERERELTITTFWRLLADAGYEVW